MEVWAGRGRGSLPPTEGAPWIRLKFATASLRCVLSSVRCALWKGEATGWGWDVLNPLINVTVPGPSSLMWNRHFESVAHAVKKRLMCWWRKGILCGDLQIIDLHLSQNSFVLSRGSDYKSYHLKSCFKTTHGHKQPSNFLPVCLWGHAFVVWKCEWWICFNSFTFLRQFTGGCLLEGFKGGAGGNYHLQDKSVPTTPPVSSSSSSPCSLHLHNISGRGEVVLGK